MSLSYGSFLRTNIYIKIITYKYIYFLHLHIPHICNIKTLNPFNTLIYNFSVDVEFYTDITHSGWIRNRNINSVTKGWDGNVGCGWPYEWTSTARLFTVLLPHKSILSKGMMHPFRIYKCGEESLMRSNPSSE